MTDVDAAAFRYDEVDVRLLSALDEDARMSVMALADRCGLARGTVQARLERFRALGLFRRHSVRVEPLHVGRAMNALVSVELDEFGLPETLMALEGIPEVLECYAPTGRSDLECRVAARDAQDLHSINEQIRRCPGVARTSTSVLLRQVIPYRMEALLEASRLEVPVPTRRRTRRRARA